MNVCGADGCCKEGKFMCKRCKSQRYCSSQCQVTSWPKHKAECKGEVQEPYAFDFSYDRSITEEVWLRSEMQKGPDQPMDPPEEYEFDQWWNDREVIVGGVLVVKSSFVSPTLKEIIRKGLRNKDITWEYLFSDNFMHLATYCWVPLQYVLQIMETVVLPAERKPRIQGMVEVIVEHFWRVNGMPGQLDYDPAVGALLRKHKVTLPFTDNKCYEDEFRQYAHRMTPPYPLQCDCFMCAARPFRQARMREAWEGLRRKAAKKGLFMMSWDSKLEFERSQEQQQGQEQQAPASEASAAATAPPAAAGVDLSNISSKDSKEKVLAWEHPGDEKQTLKSTLTKKELDELTRQIDTIAKQQRLPTNEEMNWIMSKLAVSKEQYVLETTIDAQRAVAAAAAAASKAAADSTTKASTPAVSAGKRTFTAPAVKKGPLSHQKAGAKHRGSDQPPDMCTAKMAAAELGDTQQDTTKNNNPTQAAPLLTGTGRPKRGAAAKVVSYADVGGSSDDSYGVCHRHPSSLPSAATTTAVTAGSSAGKGGDSDGAEGESFQWSDSEACGVSNSSSDDSGDEEDAPTSCDGEGSRDEGEERVESGKRESSRGRKSGTGKARKSTSGKTCTSGGTVFHWTAELDERLTAAVGLYKESGGWARVAEHMGGGITALQCNVRWNNYLCKVQQEGIKQGEWTDEELHLLQELATQHVIKRKGMTQERINWTAIGKQMNRIPVDCTNKWKLLQASRMKKGPFTAEEDALIRQRVLEWGDKGNGLWVSLEQEMGRHGQNILQRWRLRLSKR